MDTTKLEKTPALNTHRKGLWWKWESQSARLHRVEGTEWGSNQEGSLKCCLPWALQLCLPLALQHTSKSWRA